MMKKELKIGIYAVIIFLAAWVGIRFLSGADIFGNSNVYYAYYTDVSGLQSASAVTIRGVKVGQVTEVSIAPEEPTMVKVALSISNDYSIPSDSKAKIFSEGLMGGKAVEIKLGQSSEMLAEGAEIASEVEYDLMTMAREELMDVKQKAVELMTNLNTTVTSLNTLVGKNDANITSAIANLNAVLADLKESGIIDNVERFTAKLEGTGERLDSVLVNVEAITSDMKEREAGRKLAESIATLNDVLSKINSDKGTAGSLLTDRQLYDNLTTATNNLSVLLADLKENPKRYVHFSLFGAKDEQEKAAKRAAKAAKKAAKK